MKATPFTNTRVISSIPCTDGVIGILLMDLGVNKNYTLSIDSSLWQGKFDKYNIYISVIGDKSGGVMASTYLISNCTFSRYLDELRVMITVNIPIKVIHVI